MTVVAVWEESQIDEVLARLVVSYPSEGQTFAVFGLVASGSVDVRELEDPCTDSVRRLAGDVCGSEDLIRHAGAFDS